MGRIVMKFGGTSVGDLDRIKAVAEKVKAEHERGHEIAVVVSAMSGVTNQLVGFCDGITGLYDAREYDSVVASGEQVSSGLTAMALQAIGVAARSWLGWQVPIMTDDVHGKARIAEISGEALLARMAQGEVPVVAGFQGITDRNRIATLGRGGSDTSAVALAAALGAERCDIYTDVDGVYTTDPRVVAQARKLERITYEEMLEMASLGAKVLQTRSVELAMKQHVRLQVLSSFAGVLGSDLPGTLVVDEEEIMEHALVSGITDSSDDAKITLIDVADKPGIAADIFGPLAEAAINVDMIVQNISEDGRTTDVTFTVPRRELPRVNELLEQCRDSIGYDRVMTDDRVVKISVVGVGMRSHAGVAQKMFRALADKGINIQVISTSEIKISVLVDADYRELAIRALHTAYGLDAETG